MSQHRDPRNARLKRTVKDESRPTCSGYQEMEGRDRKARVKMNI